MPKEIRWGILGCGDVTEVKSGPALRSPLQSRLVSVMRRDAAKAADYAARHGVPRWTDNADALIADPELNAIYVATPPSTHADYTIRALRAGKDVLVEKPMALTPRECDAIEAAVADTGRRLSVAYYRRCLPRFERLREIVETGLIGVPRAAELRHYRPVDALPKQSWKLDPEICGGGIFADVHVHTLDWLTYLFGPPVAARGLTKRQAGRYAAEDLVAFTVDFGDVVATGLCVYATDQHDESLTIHGSDGHVSMGAFGGAPIRLVRDGQTQELRLPDPGQTHAPLIAQVVAHFRGEGPNPCDARAGRQATDMLASIYASPTMQGSNTSRR
ncbi:MAG: Gfo/Idh/MocA family oxidoreductase [Pseudomonadota bacterium]